MNTRMARVAPEKADTPTRSADARLFVGGFTEKKMSDSDEFKWNEKDAVVIPRVDAIAVYINLEGNVVIRQQDPMDNDDDVIVIPRSYVERVINGLMSAIESSAEEFGDK